MSILVFAGPSLDRADSRIPGLTYLPPAAEGDIYRATLSGPKAIALIDGYFEAQPAVWHKEILWALSQGIHVLGASSMGALRASELWSFGMVGVGAIYRAFRMGTIIDDAEVGVLHGPEELGCPSVTEAMVNVRANLSRARARGIISREERDFFLKAAAGIYYKDRTWADILAAVVRDGLDQERAGIFKAWLAKNKIDIKKRDAGKLIRLLQQFDFSRPFEAGFVFEDTTFWRDLVARHS